MTARPTLSKAPPAATEPAARTSRPPVSVALVGCGAVARLFYAPALRELERHGVLQVTALVDPSAPARAALGAQFPAAREAADLPTALAPGDARLAIVASPPRFHREQVETALAAGCDVLCEKPLAPTAADAEAMAAAATRADRLLATGHYKRFMPAHRALKAFVAQQTFGALRAIEIAEGGKFGWPAASDSFFRREQTPGGVLLDIGVHVLDLLLWWLGEPATFDYTDDARDGLEANCRLHARWSDGATARVRLSRDWKTANCYVFRFERAVVHSRVNASNQLELTFDGVPMTFAAELRDPLPPHPAGPSAPLESNAQAFIAQLVDLCDAVHTRRVPSVSAYDGARAIRWIERCYAARTPMAEPWVAPSTT